MELTAFDEAQGPQSAEMLDDRRDDRMARIIALAGQTRAARRASAEFLRRWRIEQAIKQLERNEIASSARGEMSMTSAGSPRLRSR